MSLHQTFAEITRLAPVDAQAHRSSIYVPNDELLGRIIGRDRRNMGALEAMTGATINVGEPHLARVVCASTPRREIAHRALQSMVSDGRIHPAKIEETVHSVAKEMLRQLQSIQRTRGVGTLARYSWQAGPTVSSAAKRRLGGIVGQANLYTALAALPRVDFEAGIIRNVSAMTMVDSAAGHGFSVDYTTLETLMTALAANGSRGTMMRFKHPKVDGNIETDSLGSDVGYFKSPRLTAETGVWQVRGDAVLSAYADSLPGMGDVKTYLLAKAENDPTGFGLSAVIHFETEVVFDGSGQPTTLAARILDCEFIDFVGRPAANPNGLLGAKTINIHPEGFLHV